MHNRRTLFHLAIAILVLVSAACTCALPFADSGPSLVGTWEGTYDGDTITMTFEDDGNFVFEIDGTVTSSGRYVVDMSTTPIQFDIFPDSSGPISTIIEFIDEDTLKMENNYEGQPRPATFSDTATFHRVNP